MRESVTPVGREKLVTPLDSCGLPAIPDFTLAVLAASLKPDVAGAVREEPVLPVLPKLEPSAVAADAWPGLVIEVPGILSPTAVWTVFMGVSVVLWGVLEERPVLPTVVWWPAARLLSPVVPSLTAAAANPGAVMEEPGMRGPAAVSTT